MFNGKKLYKFEYFKIFFCFMFFFQLFFHMAFYFVNGDGKLVSLEVNLGKIFERSLKLNKLVSQKHHC